MLKSIPCSLILQCANLTFSIIAITPCVFQSLKMATHCVACILQIGAHILGCPEACLAPYDPATLNRPDVPANVQQLLIIKGSSVWMQGEKFQGEVQQNCGRPDCVHLQVTRLVGHASRAGRCDCQAHHGG